MKSGGYEMTINERLEFFKEMLRCNYDVYLWTYTPELELIHIRKTHTDMAGFLYGSSLHFCFRIRGG